MIKRMDEVLAAIAAGKSNEEIRDEVDGRLSDKSINQLRRHPANADVPWPEDAKRAEEAMQAEETVPFVPEEPVQVPSAAEMVSGDEDDGEPGEAIPEWVRMMHGLIEEIDPPMSVAEAIRELAQYAATDDSDHLIAAALAIKTRMEKLKRRIGA